MSSSYSGLMMSNHSDVATAAAFNVEVQLSASAAAAAAADDEATHAQFDEQPVSVASTILATATATMSAVVEDRGAGSHGRIEQLEHDVDSVMKKMGINGISIISIISIIK